MAQTGKPKGIVARLAAGEFDEELAANKAAAAAAPPQRCEGCYAVLVPDPGFPGALICPGCDADLL